MRMSGIVSSLLQSDCKDIKGFILDCARWHCLLSEHDCDQEFNLENTLASRKEDIEIQEKYLEELKNDLERYKSLTEAEKHKDYSEYLSILEERKIDRDKDKKEKLAQVRDYVSSLFDDIELPFLKDGIENQLNQSVVDHPYKEIALAFDAFIDNEIYSLERRVKFQIENITKLKETYAENEKYLIELDKLLKKVDSK